jgi:hypothetical protein
MTKIRTLFLSAIFISLFTTAPLADPQATQSSDPAAAYRPKYQGDPARSDSEFQAIAYMTVVLRAQHHFQKQYGHFATSLAELVHTGTFTKRMVNPDRGDYTVHFKGKTDSFVLVMTPSRQDAEHRSFYAEDDGRIHAEEGQAANQDSPVVK